jgi:hypothetical protein
LALVLDVFTPLTTPLSPARPLFAVCTANALPMIGHLRAMI